MKIEVTDDLTIEFELRYSKGLVNESKRFQNLADARSFADWLENQGYKIRLLLHLES